jgi:hypothetical protein
MLVELFEFLFDDIVWAIVLTRERERLLIDN